jgi:hypothetical protein
MKLGHCSGLAERAVLFDFGVVIHYGFRPLIRQEATCGAVFR